MPDPLGDSLALGPVRGVAGRDLLAERRAAVVTIDARLAEADAAQIPVEALAALAGDAVAPVPLHIPPGPA